VVPDPEESFQLYIDDIPKDRFPNGNMDYVLNYWQTPVYQYPPPMNQRRIASVMPLQSVQNVTLNPANTALGTILFTDSNGNPVPGIMPGSETISFDGTHQMAHQDYVLNLDAGLGYASQHNTNEAIVKYVAYAKPGLFDYGISFTLDGTAQQFTIPHKDTDQVLFEFESGRFKPADKNNPAMGEEYIINYLVEGDFISNEGVTVTPGMTWFRTKQYPIKFQNAIVSKNGIILDESVEYRVSYLTGRIVFFSPLVRGDTVTVSYSPLLRKSNGFTYEDKTLFCKTYGAVTPVTNIVPVEFTLTNQNLSTVDLQVLRVHNVTKNFDYNISGYLVRGLIVHLPAIQSQVTDFNDTVFIDYKFANSSVEYTPVEYINFFVPAGSNYLAFVNQNVTSIFPANTFIRLTDIESAGDYFFRIQSSFFDGEDTIVNLYGQTPADMNNPIIYVSDAPITTFLPFPHTATNIASGNTKIYFPGTNLSRTFRVGQLLQLGSDYYSVSDSQYDQSNHQNVISLGVQTFQDYTTASILGNVSYSDCPLYYEGNTVISTTMDVIDDPQTPAMTLNYNGLVSISSDSTAFYVDNGTDKTSLFYATYPKVSQLASALTVLGLNAVDYTPDWTSSKIIPVGSAIVTKDSTTLVNILPELRLGATDTTQFTIVSGSIVLNNPLVRNQRYSLDYLGRQPLDDSTVKFSASYFSLIPAHSKISASFKFDNLDQFYVQVTGQRRFLDEVVIPLMNQEAIQQSGNVGQGGDVVGDSDMGNSSGGLTGDEYRRVDEVITCGIFKTIFDFFNGRVQSYADEIYASMGWKLCNNDGLINSTDESCGAKSVSRFFPWADYTSFPPFKITPLTGQTIPYATMGPYQPPTMLTAKARFTPGNTDVTCTTMDGTYSAYWTRQLKAGDYIRPFDTTTDYQIQTISSDSSLSLTTPYAGSATINKPFAMTSHYPLYNDDGFMGGKIIGTVSDGFGLDRTDIFNVTVDGTGDSTTLGDSLPPFITPSQLAFLLTSGLSNKTTKVTYEWVEDPTAVFGYRSVFVLRTTGTHNKIIIGQGSAMTKLGFIPDTTVFGNNVDPTSSMTTDPRPEYPFTFQEHGDLTSESKNISNVVNAAYPIGGENFINRLTVLSDVSSIRTLALDESSQITIEKIQINKEIVALSSLLLEPTMAGTPGDQSAFNTDMTYLSDCTPAQIYDATFINYQNKFTQSKWVLDILPFSQAVRGRDATGMGIDNTSLPGSISIFGENTFFLHVDPDGTNEKRFLNTTVDGSSYMPALYFVDSPFQPVDGTWNGPWQASASNQYSTSLDNVNFLFNDATGQFFLEYGISPFSYRVDATSMTIVWDGTRSKEYIFTTDSTIGAFKSDLNKLAGITASGGFDNSSSYAIIQVPLTAMTPSVGVSLDKTSMLMFTMYQDSTRSYNYLVDATSLTLIDGTIYNPLLFTTYSTIFSLRTAADNLPGIAVIAQPAHDSSQSAVLQLVSSTPVGLSAPLYDRTYSLVTLTNDNIYNLNYAIDKTGITMNWDGSGKLYSYSAYNTVGTMKTGINADIPGINATGPALNDASPSCFKPIVTTAIPPDVTVYPALRPCWAYLATTDSKLLLDRSNFVNQVRIPETAARLTFLNNRYTEVINSITSEEHFRSSNGDTGNLYNWADNRFNRSNGCEARLKQIEKQIEMNKASLNVSKRFL
jgi:hypothetical protein